jgi:hypothetical protein
MSEWQKFLVDYLIAIVEEYSIIRPVSLWLLSRVFFHYIYYIYFVPLNISHQIRIIQATCTSKHIIIHVWQVAIERCDKHFNCV